MKKKRETLSENENHVFQARLSVVWEGGGERVVKGCSVCGFACPQGDRLWGRAGGGVLDGAELFIRV